MAQLLSPIPTVAVALARQRAQIQTAEHTMAQARRTLDDSHSAIKAGEDMLGWAHQVLARSRALRTDLQAAEHRWK